MGIWMDNPHYPLHSRYMVLDPVDHAVPCFRLIYPEPDNARLLRAIMSSRPFCPPATLLYGRGREDTMVVGGHNCIGGEDIMATKRHNGRDGQDIMAKGQREDIMVGRT